MKIVLLSAASSIHTVRWANGLSDRGHEVHVVSQHPVGEPFCPAVRLHLFPFRGVVGYFIMAPAVRMLMRKINPDVVNAHYASGYGTTGRLANVRPLVLSVWGSDVYDFPYKSPLHKWLVETNLRAADQIASTSRCMADQTRILLPEFTDISIIPFGVDLQSYVGIQSEVTTYDSKLVIGTVKTMKPKYGVDTLIRSFALLLNAMRLNPEVRFHELELRLIGGGEQTDELKALAHSLGVADRVNFIGQIPHTQVPEELANFDIFVALSRYDSESFGVAVIEAGAAGLPVVVSDAGGLPEVTVDGQTGFVVKRDNPQAAAEVLEKLVLEDELRRCMGHAGKVHVADNYSWDVCVDRMLAVYEDTVRVFESRKSS